MTDVDKGKHQAERAIIAMLEGEVAKCNEYLNGRGRDQDKCEQQGHYLESMSWTISAIEDGDHWSHKDGEA